MNRCEWCCDGGIMQKYHDEEWGKPLHDDRRHFEFIVLEVLQCGLNWNMMLKKRDVFRNCFSHFDFKAIACFDEQQIERILQTEGMIKSRRKVDAIINNAKCFLAVIDEFGSFDTYIWSFTDYKTFIYRKHQEGQLEARNELSDQVSQDLKKRGFKFLGSVTVYSHLQACGIINDHESRCWMFEERVKEGNIVFI